jgi:4-hydroxy-tetrahydrodipicolinate synthase
VVEQTRGRVPVIAGAGSNCTAEAVEYARDAKEAGADATLQVAPYYNKPTSLGFLAHFRAVADAVDLPLVVYNIASRTGKNVDNPTMLELAKHRNITAVKEASGDLAQIMDLIAQKPAGFSVLSGDDNLVFPIMALGGTGVISVASNIVPDRMVRLVSAARKGDWNTARKLHYELLPLFRAIFIETNPIPIKAAMAMKGLITESYRLPMCAMVPRNRESLAAVLKEMRIA